MILHLGSFLRPRFIIFIFITSGFWILFPITGADFLIFPSNLSNIFVSGSRSKGKVENNSLSYLTGMHFVKKCKSKLCNILSCPHKC